MTMIEPGLSRYYVEQHLDWSYIVDRKTGERDGPWRYEWEAQEWADRYNGE